MWFVHTLTVYLYASIETSTAYIVNPCGHVPRPIYYSSHVSDSVNYMSTSTHVTVYIFCKCIDYTHCLSTEAACIWSFTPPKRSGLFPFFIIIFVSFTKIGIKHLSFFYKKIVIEYHFAHPLQISLNLSVLPVQVSRIFPILPDTHCPHVVLVFLHLHEVF